MDSLRMLLRLNEGTRESCITEATDALFYRMHSAQPRLGVHGCRSITRVGDG